MTSAFPRTLTPKASLSELILINGVFPEVTGQLAGNATRERIGLPIKPVIP